jgi:hypothetical protein
MTTLERGKIPSVSDTRISHVPRSGCIRPERCKGGKIVMVR